MRVLAVTKIFPNRLEPLSSPFNRQQFVALAKRADLRVVEAIPYVPLAGILGFPERASRLTKLPRTDSILGIETHYMRQLYLPRIGLPLNLPLYAGSLLPYLKMAKESDVILGTWAYPDGCASILLGLAAKKPVVVKVHGSDINVLGKRGSARAFMSALLPRADAIVSVSRALSAELVRMGVSEERIVLVPNGVDAELFHPRDRVAVRKKLGLPLHKKIVLFCGRLEPQKGVPELLSAMDEIEKHRSDVTLALIGDGMLREDVARRVARAHGSVVAPGSKTLQEVAEWHSAADVFVLPSWNEGTPNVVLEAHASGRPAVATRVGGIPDVIIEGENGFLVPPKDDAALAEGILRALDRTWSESQIVKSGPISWDDSAEQLLRVLEDASHPE